MRRLRTLVARIGGVHRSSWMLQQLEHATRGHHAAADVHRVALLGTPACRERYVDYLARTWAFEAPIEARWQEMPKLATVIDVDRRIRTPFLATDLQVLGVAPESLPPETFVGIEQALGWMYVVERGRRMNGMLHRHLGRRLPAVMAIAGNYLLASSPIGSRWVQLGYVLDELARDDACADQIILAAHRAFRAQRSGTPAMGVRAA